MSRILVTGASGLTGSAIVRRLSERGVATRALVRRPAPELAALPHVEVVLGDLANADSLAAALAGVSRAMLISSSAPDMVEVQSTFIAAAKRAGVPHVVKLSGIMPELDSPFRFARMHGEIERVLAASGLVYTNLRSGEFMNAYFRQVRLIVGKSALMLPMADARIASIDTPDLAEVAVEVLTGEGHENKTYPLTGPESLTMTEVADRLSTATGRTIRYIAVSPEDAKRARAAAGIPSYLNDALDELFAERRAGKEATVHGSEFNVHPTTFLEFATRNAAIFRGEAPAPKV
jgi:uncharacterized protein YbjT (DUF2867 family)